MQYQPGTMRQLTQTPSEHHTPQRNMSSNSLNGNLKYEGYHNQQNQLQQQYSYNTNTNMCWDRDNDFCYNQRAKYGKDRQSKYQDYNDRGDLDKSRSQISYHKKQNNYENSKTTRNLTNTQQTNQIVITVPITIKIKGRQDYTTPLKIQLLKLEKSSNTSSTSININITDDKDSKFLWSFYIPQSQFPYLKNQLKLKVDFDSFNKMLKNHIDLCESYESITSGLSQACFYAMLNIDKNNQQAQFKINQINQYRQVQQLSLSFKRANQEELIKYLSCKYDQQRSQTYKLSHMVSELQYQLNQRIKDYQKLFVDYKQHKKESDQTIKSLEKRQKQKLQTLQCRVKDKYLIQRQEMQKQHNIIVQDLKQRLDNQKNKYDQLLTSLQSTNQKTISLQSTSNSLQSQYNLLQIEHNSLKDNFNSLEGNYKKLNAEHNELIKQNTKNQYMISTLTEKNQEKNKQIGQQKKNKEQIQEQMLYLQNQLKQLNAEIADYKKNGVKSQQKIQSLTEEIENIKSKLEKKKKKNSQYVRVIQKQQQTVVDTQAKVAKLEMEVKSLIQAKDRLENIVVKDKQKRIRDLQRQLDDGKAVIQDQKKAIMHMHKQTNARFGSSATSIMPTSNYPMTSTSSTLKDYSAYGSESRIRYTGPTSGIRQTSPIADKSDRQRMVPPPIKKYREPTGAQNQRNRENSKSPIVNKLNQQLDPEDQDKTREKIGPIKFKK